MVRQLATRSSDSTMRCTLTVKVIEIPLAALLANTTRYPIRYLTPF